MPPSELNTARMQGLLEQMRKGDARAGDRLVRETVLRLENRARALMARNPVLARWSAAEDLLQEALMKFYQSLLDHRVQPQSMHEFHAIAGERMRLSLIDLAHSIRGPHGIAQNTESHPDLLAASGVSVGDAERLFVQMDETLEDWAALHEAVPLLPDTQQSVFRLRYYNGMADEEIALALGIEKASVGRIFRHARETLAARLGRAEGDVA